MSSSAKKRIRASVICVHQDRLLLVKLRDPKTRELRLFPPGGQVESQESPAATAERECREETNVTVKVLTDKYYVDNYEFTWNGQIYLCTTTYFRAEYIERCEQPVQDVSYNEGVQWLPLAEVKDALSFDRNIQKSVMVVLEL